MRSCKVSDELLCQRVQCRNLNFSMNKKNKFIATEAAYNCIVFTTEPLQPSGRGMQQVVTCMMAETIIYASEVVQINEQDRAVRYTIGDQFIQSCVEIVSSW